MANVKVKMANVKVKMANVKVKMANVWSHGRVAQFMVLAKRLEVKCKQVVSEEENPQ